MSLERRWRALTQALGAPPDDSAAARWGARFIAAYAEPHRRYHDTAHLTAVLARLDGWRDRAADPDALALAAFAHDAVYQGRPGEDEEASARLAEESGAALGLAPERVARIAALVRATAGHRPTEDPDSMLFLDADLEILAAEPAAYDAYAAAIRAEYAHVPDPLFQAGRRAVLERLLAAPRLYVHPLTPTQWESRARDNLRRELSGL